MRVVPPFLLLLAAMFTIAEGDDWPTDRHDNARSGVSRERVTLPLPLRWTFQSPFPPAPGWSMPVNGYGARKSKPNVSFDDAFHVIAVGDVCYFCSSAENRLVAIDATTGEVRWSFFMGGTPRLAPAYWQGKLYVGADDGVFRCLDASTGKRIWQVDASPNGEMMLGYGRFHAQRPIRAAGIVEDGVAHFTAGLFPQNGSEFWAVNAKDGSVLWRRRLDRGGITDVVPQGPILASHDSLWLTSRIAPTRWSKKDGSAIDFNTPFPQVPDAHEYRYYNGGSYAQIREGGEIVYGRACMLAYAPDAMLKDKWGRQKRGDLGFAWFGARQILFSQDRVYVATDDYLAGLEQKRLKDITENECRHFEEAYKKRRAASYLDLLDRHHQLSEELGSEHTEVRELENGPLKWGRDDWEQWTAELPGILSDLESKCLWMTRQKATEAMILAGDVIFAGSDERVIAFDAATGEETWAFATESRVRGLAVANGRLFVSTVDGRVRCFGDGNGSSGNVDLTLEADEADAPVFDRPDLAQRIIDVAGTRQGYCLMLGNGSTSLSAEIAQRTNLCVELVEADRAIVEDLRRDLAARRLYGGRVVVHHHNLDKLPYPPYVFDLVVDEQSFSTEQPSTEIKELLRVTKPCGGTILLKGTGDLDLEQAVERIRTQNATVEQVGGLAQVTRGTIPGTRNWTHNYATAANTYCSEDPHVRGPFGVLWYGEPGPRERIDRHAAPPVPLVVGATMFTVGNDCVMAYDIYNGICRWRRELAGAGRRNLPINTSNLAADEESLFVVVDGGRCLRLDAASGRTVQTYSLPDESEGRSTHWAWIARDGILLFGSRAEQTSNGRSAEQTSDMVFALDASTGHSVWSHLGRGIDHDGIAVAGGRVFLVDRDLTETERKDAISSTVRDDSVPDREARNRRGEPIEPDLRKSVVLDAVTGDLVWQRPWNLSDVTLDDLVVQGRTGIACMVAHDVLVIHGTGSLGHPHREFLEGKFARRALYAFDATNGEYLWGGRKGYRKRPILVGERVYAEPFAWNLKTGEQVTVPNPLSGKPQPLDLPPRLYRLRPSYGVGHDLVRRS
jgi:outer membrane protein assembly factor BamB